MRWTIKPKPPKKKVEKLAKELQIEETLASILCQRNIETYEEAKKFFRPSLENIHDPFLMKDMGKAVERIEKAIENNENILIYGDYDVDGTTAVSLVSAYLKTIYTNIATYIPDRYNEGYGISYIGIDFAFDNDFSLIIALDCGIKAIEKVAYASEKNIDFIICDHHKPGAEIPKAVAVLNPKRVDCNYPYDELCGCGIGFKLIQALGTKRGQTIVDFLPYLDLVATAIAADIVPITGENRILAHYGLQVINSHPRNGIKAIIHQIKKKELTITDVVFIIAPRINAAGRIKHGNYAVELLTEMDFDSAVQFAKVIEVFNADRKELDKKITAEALSQIIENEEENRFSTVVFQEDWHKGVIGIVASRLTETYYRPTLVFTKSGEKLAASARSVKDFDLYEALEQCTDFIEQFGGHKYAAGLTLLPENYKNFKQKFEEVVSKSIDKKLLTPEILINAEIDLAEITPKFFRIIQQMAPFGPENMKPVFKTTGVRDNGYGKRVGSDSSHLKLNLFQGDNQKTFNAIGFGLGTKIEMVENEFDIVYSLEENEWNGFVSVQLILRDLE
ncbi:MAG: single-stranded-DNA-specific exonuclease RecJ [Flavobacteriia bacterium]|nr:single-stranded-DNA-specific exonuclease RecJ [Flavobacteriia bacterium]OIP46983.1 MAG: single-stranded-DNA-specific exonuclease RecJ [Flavobacteriaceae bacterium CG2_30_31_66]PIV96602.1 MAG: single-stranded-DNA-specific exonuclease RecJ [Flavobacteriaceae bacterium CG17_big_fil_post_rev_8_21_14_2_50_31_13]PIX13984.1 MAG: single-stranded-DNA-specific exonuclease RecJ [Flavobacteriaceae bacterium CG_4_8_14_3_um_filter_31_8]PIY13888.1 MAG: single-stranded-DNA-specific exonuclease RecJ [Flavoba